MPMSGLGAFASGLEQSYDRAYQRRVQMAQLQHEEQQWQQQMQDRQRADDASRAAMAYFDSPDGGPGGPGGGALALPGSTPAPQMQPGQPSPAPGGPQPGMGPGGPGPQMAPQPGMGGPQPAPGYGPAPGMAPRAAPGDLPMPAGTPPGAPGPFAPGGAPGAAGGAPGGPGMGGPAPAGYQPGQGDPSQQAQSIIGNIARNIKARNPNIDPVTLFQAVNQSIGLVRAVQPEVKDQMQALMAQYRLDLQTQMGNIRNDLAQQRIDIANRRADDAEARGNESGWGIYDAPGGLKVRYNLRTHEATDLNGKPITDPNIIGKIGTGDPSQKPAKPPTHQQLQDMDTASQARGLIQTGAELIQQIEAHSGMVGVTGTVRRGAETLGGVFGSTQDARVFADTVHNFAKDIESLIARSAYRSSQDQRDISTLYNVGLGSNTKKLYGDIDGALRRLVSKYGPMMKQYPAEGSGAPQGGGQGPVPAPAGGAQTMHYDEQGNRVQ